MNMRAVVIVVVLAAALLIAYFGRPAQHAPTKATPEVPAIKKTQATQTMPSSTNVLTVELQTPEFSAESQQAIRISALKFDPLPSVTHLTQRMLKDAWLQWHLVGDTPHSNLYMSGICGSTRGVAYAKDAEAALPALLEFRPGESLTNGGVVRPGLYEAIVVLPTDKDAIKSSAFKIRVTRPAAWPTLTLALKESSSPLQTDGALELRVGLTWPSEKSAAASQKNRCGIEWTRIRENAEFSTTWTANELAATITSMLTKTSPAETTVRMPVKELFAESEGRVLPGEYRFRVAFSDEHFYLESNTLTVEVEGIQK